MTGLVFTLEPVEAEPFPLYLHAYAAALNVSAHALAHALAIPATSSLRIDYHAADPARIAAATGLDTERVSAMLEREAPPPALLAAWAPQGESRFCPTCLAEHRPWPAAWSRATTFWCQRHHALLAETCIECECRPSSPSRFAPRARCGHDLTATAHPPCADPHAAHAAQHFVSTLTHALRDRDASAHTRGSARATLSDLSLIAYHLAARPRRASDEPLRPWMLGARSLTAAHAILTSPDAAGPQDPLGDLLHPSSRRRAAVPGTWNGASGTLIGRIARTRARILPPGARLRYATATAQPEPGLFHGADPAPERSRRIPDQLWPDWAIRATEAPGINTAVFRSAMAVTLLLPGSTLTHSQAVRLLGPAISTATLAYHLRRLADLGQAAERLLTELALALDRHLTEVPIDYARRRRVAAGTELLSAETWHQIARATGTEPGKDRRLHNARALIYETVTGGNPAAAPDQHALPDGEDRRDYVRFIADLPTRTHTALLHHARALLDRAGAGQEPLTWSPPAAWITTRPFPGAEPDQSDPAQVHAVCRRHRPSKGRISEQSAAVELGISIEHLRYVLRRHPEPDPPRPRHPPGSIRAFPHPHTGRHYAVIAQPGAAAAFHIDPHWLREQYLTWHRTLPDIAAQIGCATRTLSQFADSLGIAKRTIGAHRNYIRTGTIHDHPSALPALLRTALTGPRGPIRVARFLMLAENHSIATVADALGITHTPLTRQLARLERDCGGALFERPGPRTPLGPLTPLGQQLKDQINANRGQITIDAAARPR